MNGIESEGNARLGKYANRASRVLAVSFSAILFTLLSCSPASRVQIVTGDVSKQQVPEKEGISPNAAKTAPGKTQSPDPETKCLDCHGPYEELVAMEPSFAFYPDMKINPHRYVPHDSKEIPDCAGCHAPHLVTPTEPVKKPTSVAWCYACHHTQDFTLCNECH